MKKETPTKAHVDELFTNPEPWEKWEQNLVVWSLVIAVIGLVILGVLINWLILKVW